MNKVELTQIVVRAMEMANNARDESELIPVASDTELFGNEGHLDSMSLVALLIDVEESLLDEGIEISLSDDRAMSQTQSPFRSVQSLVDYIDLLIRENVE